MQTLALVAIQGVGLLLYLGGKPTSVQTAGLISLAVIPPMLGLDYGLSILQGQQRFGAFNMLRSAAGVFYAVGALVLFILGVGDLVRITAVWVLATSFAGAVALLLSTKGLSGSNDGRPLPSRFQLISFGLRGLLGTASPIETLRLDQAVVGLFLTPTALGLYVVGVAFSNLPRFLGLSFGVILFPRMAAQHDRRTASRELWQFIALGAIASAAVAAILAGTVKQLVPLLFGIEYRGAVEISVILLIGAVFLATRRVLADGARGLGQPMVGTVAEAASWLWLCPALLLLTPAWGLVGVSVAFATSSLFSLVVGITKLVSVQRAQRLGSLDLIRHDGSHAL
jgi:O-antigen/teichoic acid export membrane protein